MRVFGASFSRSVINLNAFRRQRIIHHRHGSLTINN